MTRHLPTHVLVVLAAGLFSTGAARADSLSCKNRLASTGDSTYEVRAVCGEPDAANRRLEYRSFRTRGACYRRARKLVCEPGVEHTVEVVIDEWTYDFGRNRFIRYLTFEQGRLVRIDTGSYGYKPAH